MQQEDPMKLRCVHCQRLIAAIALSVTALLIFVSLANAEPIVGVPFSTTASIVCDDKLQVQDLFDGSKKDDGKGLIEAYNKWHDVIDAQHEPPKSESSLRYLSQGESI
jgi:hypothetical protein